MKRFGFILPVLALLLFGCAGNVNLSVLPAKTVPASALAAPADGIPHFSIVDTRLHIFRGGQPTAAGWKWLKDQGVTNVVKLDLEEEGSDSQAEALGMTVHRYPITTLQQLLGPRLMVARQLEWAAVHIYPCTFVHCLHGQDRTGACVFVYRELTDMPYTNAVNEMLGLGFHKSLHGLWEFVEDYQLKPHLNN